MVSRREILFLECQRCRHKSQREVPFLPLPAGARFRCSACGNRDAASIRSWTTGGSSAARVISFPKGKRAH
jgi:hypothetical protein